MTAKLLDGDDGTLEPLLGTGEILARGNYDLGSNFALARRVRNPDIFGHLFPTTPAIYDPVGGSGEDVGSPGGGGDGEGEGGGVDGSTGDTGPE